MPGHDIKDSAARDISNVNKYQDVLDKLISVKDKFIEKNQKQKNFWKFQLPEDYRNFWDEIYHQGIMAIGWDDIGDISNKTLDDINNRENPQIQNAVKNWNIIQNFRDASIGDVVIAEQGMVNVYGVGIITGTYYFDDSRDKFKHVRKVKWMINRHIDFDEYMFGPDAFSRTKKWEEIKAKYSSLKDNYKKILDKIEQGKIPEINYGKGASKNGPQNFWWLNANPNIWSIDNFDYGEIQEYTTHNEKGNKRRIYKYFTETAPGDLVIGYESSPSKQIKAIFQVIKGINKDNDGIEKITFRLIEKVSNPISWEELKDNPELKESEVIINNQGSLFKLTPNEFDIIRDIIDEQNIIEEKKKEDTEIIPYDFQSDPDKPFMEPDKVEDIKTALHLKKNIVLQGPPGTGKTFIAKKIAYDMMGEKDDTKIEMIQFHQSYSYEDFIQGIRPAGNEFRVKNGVFYNFCKMAERDKQNPYFFIIDEINRGNLSKIFGELMMLIENDKRGDRYSIPLTYSENQEERFSVPENVYIIGTMNTADRSLAIVDYALRRRFDFITIYPQFNEAFKKYLTDKNITPEKVDRLIEVFRQLNQRITKDKNLGKGFQVGHSYFCNNEIDGSNFDQKYKHIIEYEIVPLLEEYWFDNLDKVESEREDLLKI
jgi:5-methylcytosine-specific restriction protein B